MINFKSLLFMIPLYSGKQYGINNVTLFGIIRILTLHSVYQAWINAFDMGTGNWEQQ